jgi:hypothetical protein
MIPPLLHQTWKTDRLPVRFAGYVESWQRHNPAWTRILWTDRMLLEFVAEHYPDFLSTFCSYCLGVQRADAARYLLLHHFGGIYADIDCRCVAPFDPIMDEERVVLCKEPPSHADRQATLRGLPYLVFNGTMASPPGHPFWSHVLAYLPGLAQANETLDATGPCLLTSAQLSFPNQAGLVIHPSHLFTPLNSNGAREAGTTGRVELSIHDWAGTWWSPKPAGKWHDRLRLAFYKTRYRLERGEHLCETTARLSVDAAALTASAPRGDNLAILVPLRDAEQHIESFLKAVGGLEHPKEKTKLVFCEGDSADDSWERLQAAVEPLRKEYRHIVLLQKQVGTRIDRSKRWKAKIQRARRAGIASVRNHLIDHGLDASDDWALWMDIDVWHFPADMVRRLVNTGGRIVTPNCVKVPGGPSFDLNAFVTLHPEKDYRYYRATRRGLYQPPANTVRRMHLSDVRHLERIDLHSVGGTMLLVDAALHRAGLRFPEIPYCDLIETEGFAALARDLGIIPLGLPKVEVLHVPW